MKGTPDMVHDGSYLEVKGTPDMVHDGSYLEVKGTPDMVATLRWRVPLIWYMMGATLR